MADKKPRMLVISHVLPFPGTAGQQMRVAYTLQAAKDAFDIDFLTIAPSQDIPDIRERLAPFCQRSIILAAKAPTSGWKRALYSASALGFTMRTGLKSSNYRIGCVELSRSRLMKAIGPTDYAAVLYEYIHAADSVPLFSARHMPTVVDTHNVLWRSRERELEHQKIPAAVKKLLLRNYRKAEEKAWLAFDSLIAINRSEEAYIQTRIQQSKKIFYAPMGIDLSRWPLNWRPSTPPRIAFYGGMGSEVNQTAAQRCLDVLLPQVWQQQPETEFWVVGSNPPCWLQSRAKGKVKVTGFVERPQEVLGSMTLVLCPWTATYGFRSRLVEVMALGVPIVVSPEAVDGMEFEHERGVLFGSNDPELAKQSVRLLSDRAFAEAQSRLARDTVERLYSLESTYGRLISELHTWVQHRQTAEISSAA